MTDTANDVDPHVGSPFQVTAMDDGVLELEEVRRLGEQPGAPRERPFALVFTGPTEARLPQQTHRLSHERLGDLEIFLVPIGPGADPLPRYEAVFN